MKPSTQVIANIRMFVRLTSLTVDPRYKKRFRTEFDLMEAIDVLSIYFHETHRMIGVKMYRGQVFDVIEDVKRATEEYFLTDRTPTESLIARGKNLNMYHLAVVPIIEMFKDLKHVDMLKTLDESLEAIKEVILSMDLPTHYDDGLVALAQVGDLIKVREQARKLEISTRKRKKRKSKKEEFLDHVQTEITETEDLRSIPLSF